MKKIGLTLPFLLIALGCGTGVVISLKTLAGLFVRCENPDQLR